MSNHVKAKKRKFAAPTREIWFFVGTVWYMELLLQILSGWSLTFARFWIVALFSAFYGAMLCAFASLIGAWRGKRAVLCSLLAVLGVVFATQYFLYTSYHTYMNLDSILAGGGNVAAEFNDIVFTLIFRRFWVIILFLLPTLFYALFGKKRLPFDSGTIFRTALCLLGAAVSFGLAFLCVNLSIDKQLYRNQFNFDAACHSFGLLTGCRLDLSYDEAAAQLSFQNVQQEAPAQQDEPPSEPEQTAPDAQAEPEAKQPTYVKHTLDIDFAALAESETDSTISNLHSYVASLSADSSNDFTGLFAGKNLILITAEAFSKEVLDPNLTPTLYRLATKGIVFDDYYQPAWGGSTSTGEYSNIIGLIPTDGVQSIVDTVGHNLYFTLGNQLQRLGYHSAAYHNNTYTYYDRNLTHQNIGYSTFTGLGNGLEEGVVETWPESDLEMIDFTVPQYINKQPFSVYYMTVSGHGNYLTGNAIADKNYDAVKDLDKCEAVKRYLAANLELEYAMKSLLQQLEAAGIADDTVIVLGTDHYPYGLEKSETWGNDENYLAALFGYDPVMNTEQDHSALIVWSGCLEKMEKIKVTTPVYSLDIVPTLSNLFGLEYDSRLLVGRDVFSQREPLVIWQDYSWLTDKGYYSTSYGTFTPNEGVTVPDDYVERIKAIVANKFTFSRGVLNNDYYGILFGEDDVE